MATGVGLRIADDACIAAIATDSGEPAAGDPHYIVRDCVLHMSDEGDAALGGDAPAGHTHSIRDFVAALGDPNGVSVDDGEAYRAEDLVATAIFCLINLSAEHLVGPAEFYATHPAGWPAEHVQGLREALDYLGLRSVVLVDEADLPPATGPERGRELAHSAARSALAAVLATPAGLTPPDPTASENALESTDIIPSLDGPVLAQAYSAAVPVAVPAPAAPAEPEQTAVATAAAPPEKIAGTKPAARNRIPLLVAAAVVVGTLLGGLGVALLFRGTESPPVPPLPDARSTPQTSTSTETPPPPPPPPAVIPPVVVTTTLVTPEPTPEPAPPPPPPIPLETTTETATSTERPTTTTRRPTTTRPTWPRNPWDVPYPTYPPGFPQRTWSLPGAR